MIYSRKHNYVFIHIPKTGGTSMARALEARAAADDIMLGDTPKALKRRHKVKGVAATGRLWKHSTLSDIVGLVTPEQIAQARVFTMVRNPWDRVVSYYHWLRGQGFDHPAVGLAKRLEFSAFLNHPQIKASLAAHPYASYVSDAQGVERCDLFVRLEHLSEDIPRLERLIELPVGPLPHDNRSDREKSYASYYSKEDQHLVGDLLREDIGRFGYQFR